VRGVERVLVQGTSSGAGNVIPSFRLRSSPDRACASRRRSRQSTVGTSALHALPRPPSPPRSTGTRRRDGFGSSTAFGLRVDSGLQPRRRGRPFMKLFDRQAARAQDQRRGAQRRRAAFFNGGGHLVIRAQEASAAMLVLARAEARWRVVTTTAAHWPRYPRRQEARFFDLTAPPHRRSGMIPRLF
jgi:hypothetical protein